ncbi:CHC2 zinc finger domain-containing protein [Alicycliphilus denitrificans]|uniref:Zinc finger CHC2-type domain-containing protein n=1 Tax=Alicycliphilus denitrificans (strain DSM 14773 / CIP 107495 / K601) TaxID=596154 RepID=F4G3M3_ALIDK|nr:CHC2 zinc finger domain-containing protein [Alicycliphilus denitrificans]AEB82851.1 hypothetical protein Alide2_0429 [Alicycliphilus denitrificans K601]
MSFDKTRLPEPVSYYESQGLAFKERKGKWRTTACNFHGSTDSLRINTDSGSFVCMTGCGARGGDVLAYHQAAHGLGFIDAAKELGAWVDDGKDVGRTRPTPLPARDALVVLAAEANLVAVAAANVAHGVVLTQIDLSRLLTASGRISRIMEVFA